MTVTVREARADDLAALVGLLVGGSLTVETPNLRGLPPDLEPYARALEAIGADPTAAVLVAELDGEVVGMCQVMVLRHLQHAGGLCAEIESMHVAAAQRGGGIGGTLLEAAVARAAASGCYRVQLTSNLARTDAHRFYLRHGFDATHAGFKRLL